MTKLIDLSHRKEATDLLVDCALLAVWYGYPESSQLLVQWMRHRSDNASPVMYIDALRYLRFENFEDAERVLKELLDRFPDDPHARALLLHVLFAKDEIGATEELSASFAIDTLEPTVRSLVENIRTRLARAPAKRSTLSSSVVMG